MLDFRLALKYALSPLMKYALSPLMKYTLSPLMKYTLSPLMKYTLSPLMKYTMYDFSESLPYPFAVALSCTPLPLGPYRPPWLPLQASASDLQDIEEWQLQKVKPHRASVYVYTPVLACPALFWSLQGSARAHPRIILKCRSLQYNTNAESVHTCYRV